MFDGFFIKFNFVYVDNGYTILIYFTTRFLFLNDVRLAFERVPKKLANI